MKSTKSLLRAVVFVTIALLAATFFAQEKPSPLSEEEEGALGRTRTVNTAEVTYNMTYTKGYSVNLRVLGEGPKGSPATEKQSGLIAKELAHGKWHNYIYIYNPGAKDKDGRISAYTMTVRPAKWQKGLVSFFTDQTGVIRWTRENRAPTAKDEPIDSL